METPTITIDLKKHLHDFLLHEFKTDPSGAIVVHLKSDIGLFISSMYNVSDLPRKELELANPVKIILPINRKNWYIFSTRFIYVPVWKQTMINNHLEAVWRLRIKEFFCIGYKKKFQQKDIIEGILKHYGMKNNAVNFDQIKKLDYRDRENFKKQVFDEIQSSIIQ